MDDEDIFEVKQILKRRIKNGKMEYLVRWEGFASDEDTWEPEENLSECRELIRKFLTSLKDEDLSPRVTHRRSQALVPKKKPKYTQLKRRSECKILHLSTPPPGKKDQMKIEEEKPKKEEDKSETKLPEDEKPSIHKTPIYPARIFLILAVILIFVIVFTTFFNW